LLAVEALVGVAGSDDLWLLCHASLVIQVRAGGPIHPRARSSTPTVGQPVGPWVALETADEVAARLGERLGDWPT